MPWENRPRQDPPPHPGSAATAQEMRRHRRTSSISGISWGGRGGHWVRVGELPHCWELVPGVSWARPRWPQNLHSQSRPTHLGGHEGSRLPAGSDWGHTLGPHDRLFHCVGRKLDWGRRWGLQALGAWGGPSGCVSQGPTPRQGAREDTLLRLQIWFVLHPTLLRGPQLLGGNRMASGRGSFLFSVLFDLLCF